MLVSNGNRVGSGVPAVLGTNCDLVVGDHDGWPVSRSAGVCVGWSLSIWLGMNVDVLDSVSVSMADGYVLGMSVVLGTDVFGHIDGLCVGALIGPQLNVLLSSGVGTSVRSTVGSIDGCVSRRGAKLRPAVSTVLGLSVDQPMGGLVSTGCIEGSNVGVSDGDSLGASVHSVGAMPSSGHIVGVTVGVMVGTFSAPVGVHAVLG